MLLGKNVPAAIGPSLAGSLPASPELNLSPRSIIWPDLVSLPNASEHGSGELRILLDSDENGEDPIPATKLKTIETSKSRGNGADCSGFGLFAIQAE